MLVLTSICKGSSTSDEWHGNGNGNGEEKRCKFVHWKDKEMEKNHVFNKFSYLILIKF